MKRLALCAAAASAVCAASAGDMSKTPGTVCDVLERAHVSHRAPDDVISRRAWTNLVESCDQQRLTFLASDIERFAKQETSLDDMFKKGDFSFALDVRRTYLKRLEARTAFATNYLAKASFDFTKKGKWRTDRSDAQWPATEAAADRLWRAKLKSATLDAFLACETGGVKNAAAKVSKKLVAALERERRRSAGESTNDFVTAIVSSYDAHTNYLSPALSNSLMGEMSLSMCGIGAEWIPEDDRGIRLRRVIPGGPLAKDGRIATGDLIVAVSPKADGKFTTLEGVSGNEGAALFFGEKGAPITLRVEHADGRRGDYTLKRDKINLDSEAASSSVVPSSDKSAPKLGYLRLQSFYVSAPTGKDDKPRSSCEDMAERLRELAKAKVDGVLLDLRGNGGGSLHDAVRIIGLFVRSGPAVQLTTAAGTVPVDVVPDETVCDTPVVVLVDGLSASASELVSGTLQDLGRAVIAGDVQTVGKGTAQTSVDLAETENGGEGTILVTNGKFYRVTGSSTQFKGVASDIILPSASPDSIREEDLDYPLPWDEIARAPHEKAWDLDKFIPELRKASEERRAKSKVWKKHARMIRLAEKCKKRKAKSLEINTRRKQLAEEKTLRENALRRSDYGFKPAKRKADPVLDEGLNILADLVRLNGGRKLPAVKVQAAPASDVLFDSLDD